MVHRPLASQEHQQNRGTVLYLLHPLSGYPHAHTISDVEAQRLVGAVLVQPHPSVRLRQDVHIDDGGDLSEVLWRTNKGARFAPGVCGAWVQSC